MNIWWGKFNTVQQQYIVTYINTVKNYRFNKKKLKTFNKKKILAINFFLNSLHLHFRDTV